MTVSAGLKSLISLHSQNIHPTKERIYGVINTPGLAEYGPSFHVRARPKLPSHHFATVESAALLTLSLLCCPRVLCLSLASSLPPHGSTL